MAGVEGGAPDHYLEQGRVKQDRLLDHAWHVEGLFKLGRQVVDVADKNDDGRLDLVQRVGRDDRELVLNGNKKEGNENKIK